MHVKHAYNYNEIKCAYNIFFCINYYSAFDIKSCLIFPKKKINKLLQVFTRLVRLKNLKRKCNQLDCIITFLCV